MQLNSNISRIVLALVLALVLANRPASAAPESPEEQLAAASALFDAQKYAEAARKLDAFLVANPKHAKAGPAALALGRCRSELKQWPQAIPAYEKAVASQEVSVMSVARLGLGEAALNAKQYEKAISALERAAQATLTPAQGAAAWFWLAQANFGLGRFGPAEEAYIRVFRDFRRDDLAPDARYGWALCALQQGKPDVARDRLQDFIRRFARGDAHAQAQLTMAQIDLQAKRYDPARSNFEAVIAYYSNQGRSVAPFRDAEEGLIQTLIQTGDYAGAAGRLDQVIAALPAAEPQRFRALLTLGHCRYRQKDFDKALAAYIEAAKSPESPTAADALYWSGNANLGLNKPADAAAQFSRLPARFPNSELAAKATFKSGEAYRAAKQDDAASAAFRVVIEKYPQSEHAGQAKQALAAIVDSASDPAQLANALKNAPPSERARGTIRLARLLIASKREADAVAHLSALTKAGAEPDILAEAQYLLGCCLLTQNKQAAAADALAVSVKRAPNAPWAGDARRRLSWVYIALKQPASAEKSAQAVLEAKPDAEAATDARLALVQAQLDQQKWDASLETCKQLMSGSPSQDVQATVLYTQAWVTEKRGKSDDAIPLWERLAADFKTSQYGGQAALRVADARMKAGKFEEARDQYSALLGSNPAPANQAELHFKLGSALYNLDKPAEAAVEFDHAVEQKTPGDYAPEALYWAGVALDKAGKKEDAIQRLTKLVTQFPNHARISNAKIRLAALKATAGK